MAYELKGIFTPNPVPLMPNGDVNEDELRRYIDWLIRKGVHGLYPNGSTGEFTRFTQDERKRIAKIVCEVCEGRVPVLAGAAEANLRETLSACATYADYGATAVAIVAPFYYKISQDAMFEYFKQIGEQSPIDVTLYNIPMFSNPIEVSTIKRLAETCPRIIGIKDSSGDLSFMLRMMNEVKKVRPDFSFLSGWDAIIVPKLIMGVDGGTNATSGVVPELTRMMYDKVMGGDLEGARCLQFRMLELFDNMIYSADFPEGVKAAAELRGFNFGPSRQPMSPNAQIDRAALKDVLQCIMSEFGYVDEPLGGCADRCGNIDTDRISQIAQAVTATLKERGVI